VATPGEVYLRLWFYPITSVQSQQNYNPAASIYSVTANGYALQNNLKAAQTQSGNNEFLFVENISQFLLTLEVLLQAFLRLLSL
jgi:hypothetical protein